MKDRFGNEINVGDTVVFVSKSRYSHLEYGTVTELKNNDKIEILYMVYGYYEKLPPENGKDVIAVKGGLFTAYAARESRNISVIRNTQLRIERKEA